jgi:S1-C subfamily serine protease
LTIIEAKKPGDEVVVSVVREGRETEISVTLGAGE